MWSGKAETNNNNIQFCIENDSSIHVGFFFSFGIPRPILLRGMKKLINQTEKQRGSG